MIARSSAESDADSDSSNCEDCGKPLDSQMNPIDCLAIDSFRCSICSFASRVAASTSVNASKSSDGFHAHGGEQVGHHAADKETDDHGGIGKFEFHVLAQPFETVREVGK